MARGFQQSPMEKFVTCAEQKGRVLFNTLTALGARNVSELFSTDGETITLYYVCPKFKAPYFRGVVEGITTAQAQHVKRDM